MCCSVALCCALPLSLVAGKAEAGSGPGFLRSVFSTPQAENYTFLWGLLAPIADQLEETAKAGTSLTILAPSNAAFLGIQDALEVELSLLPTEATRAFFGAKLLEYHALPQFFAAAGAKVRRQLQGAPGLVLCCFHT